MTPSESLRMNPLLLSLSGYLVLQRGRDGSGSPQLCSQLCSGVKHCWTSSPKGVEADTNVFGLFLLPGCAL